VNDLVWIIVSSVCRCMGFSIGVFVEGVVCGVCLVIVILVFSELGLVFDV